MSFALSNTAASSPNGMSVGEGPAAIFEAIENLKEQIAELRARTRG
jgi:hypothetical protein